MKRITLAFLVTLCSVASVIAEDFENDIQSFKELSDKQLEMYLAVLHFSKVERGRPNEDGTTLFKLWDEERSFCLQHNRKDHQVRMVASVEHAAGTTQEKLRTVNAWNATNRFSKAMIAEDGTFMVEGKLNYRAGATNFGVIGAVEEFAFTTMPGYMSFIQDWLPKE